MNLIPFSTEVYTKSMPALIYRISWYSKVNDAENYILELSNAEFYIGLNKYTFLVLVHLVLYLTYQLVVID